MRYNASHHLGAQTLVMCVLSKPYSLSSWSVQTLEEGVIRVFFRIIIMNEKNTLTRVRDSEHVINILTELKSLLELSETDPLARESILLYDHVVETLEEVHNELKQLRRLQNENS